MSQEPLWLASAKKLAFGQRRKIICCGASPSLIIEHNQQGYRGHCFRSQDHGGFVPHSSMLTLQQLKERSLHRASLIQSLASPSSSTSLMDLYKASVPMSLSSTPSDMMNKGCVWVLKGGVSLSTATSYGLRWTDKYERVVLPVWHRHGGKSSNVLDALVLRSVHEKPKYIIKYREGLNYAIFTSDDALLLPDRAPCAVGLVLVEDALSAIRVGRLVSSAAVLGTTMGDAEVAVRDIASGRPIAVWLDGDKAGRQGRDKIVRKLQLLGCDVRRINTPKDPKLYSNREIQEILLSLT